MTDSQQAETDEQINIFDLSQDDAVLQKNLVDTLDQNKSHWNKEPFNLEQTDETNMKYLWGDQLDQKKIKSRHGTPYIDNRLFSSTRAVLAYVSARVATPEVTPSDSSHVSVKLAEDLGQALQQHGIDNDLDQLVKIATKNLVTRKRGYLKLRFDPNQGPYGDIVVEVVDPSDVIIDRHAKYMDDPRVIYFKQEMSLEDLLAKFPDKEKEISLALDGDTDSSRMITIYEAWFIYFDEGKKRQGLAWFMKQDKLILGKMENPNWIYTGDETQDRIVNLTTEPIKPLIQFNYFNSGRSYIDETCLLDQARPQQDLLNKRGKQIWENADYQNGRVIANKNIMDESDANKFLNKHPKTIMLVDSEDLNRDVKVVQANPMPSYVYDTLLDARNEIDQLMGTPNIFRGQTQRDADTLGENIMIKEQAGALQDDLARSVDEAMGKYYKYLLQMMKVYYTEDHWFHIKGADGKFASIMLNSDNIDSNVKLSVQAGSTLPSNKTELRNIYLQLAEIGKISDVDLLKGLELPDAEKMAERLIKQQADPGAYLTDVRDIRFSRNANVDIEMLLAGKQPEDRDEYDESYIEHLNNFLMSNRFAKLTQEQKQAVVGFIQEVTLKVSRSVMLGNQAEAANQEQEPQQEVTNQPPV